MKVKTLFIISIIGVSPILCLAQKANWQNLDLQKDSTFGISTEKAYTELLKGKKAQTVIVAVIDAGVDTAHEDLKAVIWTNPKRTKIHDIHGWDFIGGLTGDVQFDNLELVRQVRQQQARFEKDSTSDPVAFGKYRQERNELAKKLREAKNILANIKGFKQVLSGMSQKIGKQEPSLSDFQAYVPQNDMEGRVKAVVINALQGNPDFNAFEAQQIDEGIKYYQAQVDYQLNIVYDPRSIVGDDYFNSTQRNYGNNDVTGPDATHGTHVAGIIAAVRNNNLGINGVADHVQIMSVRTVPDGDERDKDVANAIRYATDNGARVINMSFGKAYSQDKKAVDEAVKYAISKDVLLIQAAGNDNKNIDSAANFPNRIYADGTGQAGAWIVVGASGWKNDTTLKAPFSNYGKTTVDVFAPGEQIYSCIPGSKYASFDGTSMACPVVAGLAALIREYYPRLKAAEVKAIILKSVVKSDYLKEKCITGGVVNAYNALLLAPNAEGAL